VTLHHSIETSLLMDLFKELADMRVKTVVLQKCRDKNEFVVEHPIFSDRLVLEDVSKYFDNFYIR
ncbi:MAG: hypothetical protein LBB12_01365, partial [Holosporaceae bacterium]|nr:hypothetical protein [Holosporaceae bacterium]